MSEQKFETESTIIQKPLSKVIVRDTSKPLSWNLS